MLKEDLLKCDQYSEQAKLLSKYQVSTNEELSVLMEMLEAEMGDLGRMRDEMRLVTKRSLPEAEIMKAREKVKELTSEIRRLRHELKVCGDIQERSGHVRENLEIIDREKQRGRER